MANNDSGIPAKDLGKIARFITLNHAYICDCWVEAFGEDAMRFYE